MKLFLHVNVLLRIAIYKANEVHDVRPFDANQLVMTFVGIDLMLTIQTKSVVPVIAGLRFKAKAQLEANRGITIYSCFKLEARIMSSSK